MGPCVRRDDTDVIACDNRDAFAHGSERDEAIHFLCCAMDCFGEPAIGRRFAPTRWLAMTAKEELAVHEGEGAELAMTIANARVGLFENVENECW